MRRGRLLLCALPALAIAWAAVPSTASADGLLPTIVIPQHVLTELMRAMPAEEAPASAHDSEPAPSGDETSNDEAGTAAPSVRIDIPPTVENMVRLLGRGVDIGGRDTRRDGGLAVQLRPKGSGAVFRAVLRF